MDKEKTVKNIHAGHRRRVKANVRENGFSQLEDHKLLELILFYAIPQSDTNELAHRLLDEFGSVKGVVSAGIDNLMQVDGVGESTAIMISAIGEMFRRGHDKATDRRKVYKSHRDYCELVSSFLAAEPREKAMAFYFDSSDRLRKAVDLSVGDFVSVQVDVKAVMHNAVVLEAAKVVLAHNHPDGSIMPSLCDVDATRSLSVMLRKLGLVLCDHIIVNGVDEPFSMYGDESFRRIFY